MLTPEAQSRIAELRAKFLAGTATMDDQREAIRLLREGRATAVKASQASKSKKAPQKSATELLDELRGL